VAKKAKYPSQKLTEEDKQIIGQISLKYAAACFALIGKYPNPKDYAEKVLLRMIRSRKDVAVIHTLAIAKNSTANHLHKPREINKKLAGVMQTDFVSDFKNGMSEQEFSRFFHPREMRKVLKEVEGMGVFDRLTGKKEMRDLERATRHAGKKPSDGYKRDLGGKPSTYKVTQELEKLKNVMEKPGAIELVWENIARSGIAYELVKYQQLALWHAAKMDETLLSKLLGYGTFFFPDLKGRKIPDFKNVHQRLALLDDSRLEQFADYCTKILIKRNDYQNFFIAIFGLPEF
jgi:hypothetical protein